MDKIEQCGQTSIIWTKLDKIGQYGESWTIWTKLDNVDKLGQYGKNENMDKSKWTKSAKK